MKIPIAEILPSPDLPTVPNGQHTRRRPRRGRITPLVERDSIGRFVLIAGGNDLKAAKNAGAETIEVIVRANIPHRERLEHQLAEQYFDSLLPPMSMAKAFISYRKRYGATQRDLSRRTGIKAAALHHYESLVLSLAPKLAADLDTGLLTFKEARCLADLDSHERQREIAEPFVSGKLSSTSVEMLVKRAKEFPHLTLTQLFAQRPPTPTRKQAPVPVPVTELPATPKDRRHIAPVIKTQTVKDVALMLAGQCGTLPEQVMPVYEKMALASALRLLDTRLHEAVKFLENGSLKSRR